MPCFSALRLAQGQECKTAALQVLAPKKPCQRYTLQQLTCCIRAAGGKSRGRADLPVRVERLCGSHLISVHRKVQLAALVMGHARECWTGQRITIWTELCLHAQRGTSGAATVVFSDECGVPSPLEGCLPRSGCCHDSKHPGVRLLMKALAVSMICQPKTLGARKSHRCNQICTKTSPIPYNRHSLLPAVPGVLPE